MREIKVRGLVIEPLAHGGKWITGNDEYHDIYMNHADKLAYIQEHPVHYESISEYTGLDTDNDEEIFRKDLLEITDNQGNKVVIEVVFEDGCYYGDLVKSEVVNPTFTIVQYAFGEYEHVNYTVVDESEPLFIIQQFMEFDNLKIIGNTVEHPELLEGVTS
ncbi:YopX family protein [Virgibacillus sp. AGTR]|uniref:YopX family protein n=1 Tax=Virgibacillus sp. AGTR TaxID=2812055 RepID=UPI0019638375|nr:YopX family protein [Virgibacillus sp. AGTR]MCC2250516.1 YopX family protein [Virgibacillus sp. AGTR]QRZ17495.1 hypothetical protein JUJ52_17255 [Virgibacillus sp. AGTR]